MKFLKENESNIKAEFYIPFVVNSLIESNVIKLKVLDTPSLWFGVTYAEDRQSVVDKLKALTDVGEYPEKLW